MVGNQYSCMLRLHMCWHHFLGRSRYMQRSFSDVRLREQCSDLFLGRAGVQMCKGVDHLKATLAEVEKLGGEGLMLREPKSKYVNGAIGVGCFEYRFSTSSLCLRGLCQSIFI